MVADPVPDAISRISHPAPLVAVQAHESEVVIVTFCVSPPATKLCDVALSENVQVLDPS
jgi:hypothetical protein